VEREHGGPPNLEKGQLVRIMPKGISKADWDHVTELACDVVNASEAEDAVWNASATNALLAYLQKLLQQYGDHPSILSTIGDFLDDPGERMSYYERALSLARERGDRAEEQETLDSIKHLKEIDS